MALSSVVFGAAVGCLDSTDLVRRTVVDDPELPALEFNGARFHVQQFGDPARPTIIFLHGGPGGDDSRSQLVFGDRFDGVSLADDYHLVFWDQRGVGLSERHEPERLQFSDFLADLEGLVDTVAPGRRVILISESWGGQYAAMYMDAHPERIAGAVFIESGPFRSDLLDASDVYGIDIGAEWVSDLAWLNQMVRAEGHERADYTVGNLFLISGPSGTQPQREEQTVGLLWRAGAAVFIHVMNKQLFNGDYDFSRNLGKVEPEMLFIVGGETLDLGAEFQNEQRALFPHSRLVVLEGAGHDIAGAYAPQATAVIRDYLAGLNLEGAWR